MKAEPKLATYFASDFYTKRAAALLQPATSRPSPATHAVGSRRGAGTRSTMPCALLRCSNPQRISPSLPYSRARLSPRRTGSHSLWELATATAPSARPSRRRFRPRHGARQARRRCSSQEGECGGARGERRSSARLVVTRSHARVGAHKLYGFAKDERARVNLR